MKTDWNNVASWYGEYLKGDDTYQAQVIAPNLLRLLELSPEKRILDVACGDGYFTKLCAPHVKEIVGIDMADMLLKKAIEGKRENEHYVYGDAEKIESLSLGTFDGAYCVLACENIQHIQAMLQGVSTSLEGKGNFIIVMLHPCFRIPKHSDWGYNEIQKLQYRSVYKYLSEISIPITLHPFKGNDTETTTFHRSIQWYMKEFKKASFVVSNIEEWISHKKSQPGSRAQAEDRARKEIPMFMAFVLTKK